MIIIKDKDLVKAGMCKIIRWITVARKVFHFSFKGNGMVGFCRKDWRPKSSRSINLNMMEEAGRETVCKVSLWRSSLEPQLIRNFKPSIRTSADRTNRPARLPSEFPHSSWIPVQFILFGDNTDSPHLSISYIYISYFHRKLICLQCRNIFHPLVIKDLCTSQISDLRASLWLLLSFTSHEGLHTFACPCDFTWFPSYTSGTDQSHQLP